MPGILLILLLLPTAAAAQPATAMLTGVVHDQSGGVVPGATIAVVRVGTRRPQTIVSSETGTYTFPAMTPGVYSVTVELAGFRPQRYQDLRLHAGETLRLDVALSPAGITEAVTIVDLPPLLRTEGGSIANVFEDRTIVSLPSNGRNFIGLAALVPGVTLPPGSTFPRINGGRPRTNEYLFDGISVLQPEPGQVAFFPILDAIEGLTIETNSPPAEFGRFNGGVLNLTTKSGTNAVRGTVFEFLRHERLNARNYFASGSGPKPLFRRNHFGGVVGGPVRRDRTFFFADYQGQRQEIARTAISTVPTALQRRGIFTEPIAGRVPAIYDPATRMAFPGNVIPDTLFDPVASSLLSRYPLPTSSGTANNFRRVADEVNDQDQFDVRIDHHFGDDRDLVFGRVSSFDDYFLPVTPLPDGSGATAGTPGTQDTSVWALVVGHRRAFSMHLLNELRVGDTRRAVHRRGLPIPAYVIAGYQQLGSPPNTASDFATGVRQITNTLTWIRGRHTAKAGFDLRWSRLDIVQPPSPHGSFQFNTLFTDLPGTPNTGASFASFLLGQVQSFSIDLQQQEIRNRARVWEYFAQDDWRISERFTLNGGLRYTLNFPSYEEHDQSAVFNLETQALDYLGRNGQPRTARRLHKMNFGPRLGVTGRVSDRSVARLGYALVWIEQAGITTPFTTPVFPFLQTLSQRTLDNLTPAFVLSDGAHVQPVPATATAGQGQGVFAVDRELGSGYVQQWNLSLQRAISSDASFEVAYVGSKITHVGIPDTNLNQLSVDQLALGQSLLQRVPNPFVGTIPSSSTLGEPTITVAQLMKPYPRYTSVSLYRNNVGNTNYHGLTLKLEQRLSRGLSYSVVYTRSKLMDDASSVFDASILTGPVVNYPAADSFNRTLERDVSTGDIPNILAASAIWEIPGSRGWTVSAIAILQSGAPLAVTQQTNFNAFAGFGIQRPNRQGNPNLPAGERTTGRWFDTGAFSTAPQFTIGNSSRNPVRGPAFRNLDVALTRTVRLSHRVATELRVEVFNALNTPALGAPNTVFGSAAFGSITSAGDPRVVQLAVKLLF